MQKKNRVKRGMAIVLMFLYMVTNLSMESLAVAMVPKNTPEYVKGTAEDTSKDTHEQDLSTYSINYDPNDGLITYGVVGKVGACEENDTNNEIYKGSRFKSFPTDYEGLLNEDGTSMFPGCSEAGYDYTAMLTYAINQEANNAASGKEKYEIRVEEGVYYFKGALKVWGEFRLNGVYGKTVFVCEQNVDGALFKASTNQTYYQGGSITDITFVAKGAHESFVPTESAANIHGNTLNLRIKPVEDFYCFQGMNISWFTLKNCTISGFAAPLQGVKGHMCSHIQNNTFGPCMVALSGLHFIDCFIHDNYFMGTAILRDTNPKDGVDRHMDLSLFTTGIGPNLTTINNNYIENFFYGQGQSDSYGVTYTNNTYDRVYGIEFYTAGDATNAVSQCLFKNNTYQDIGAFFEGLGYTPYSASNTGENTYVIHALSYNHNDNIGGKAFNKVQADNRAYIIELAGGTTITQCKFQEKNMTDTELFRLGYMSHAYRDKLITGTQVLDNAYEIVSYQKDDIFRDNINLKNNSMREEWGNKYFLSKKTTPEACIYYSPNGCIKIDMSCFFNPANNETLGYKALSSKIGADEAELSSTVAKQYYEDIKAGRKVVYLSDFGATADDHAGDSMSIQKAFDTIAETGDILVVEGTYNISTPILLRGGKTYRVVCNGGKVTQNKELLGGGFCLNVQDETLVKTGAFVQDKDDTGKVSGYFLNLHMNPNNIGQGIKTIERDGVAFYQVRFDKMYIADYTIGYMESVFKECTFQNSIVEKGYSQYCPYGIMNRCIFESSVLRHAYATGSLCDYGNGYTYAYYLVDTDFVQSTMRGNWIEFMQMSNGFRFNGEGNSLYTGNVWDYVWNFQFGRNDIFSGNNLTHCATVSITNHLAGPDNVPREQWSSEIRAGNITSMHVSDGLKIVGNVFSDGSTQYTTYFNFDGRTTLYDNGGKIATSISNARIAGNLTGGAANAHEMVQVLCSDTLLKENCKNNQIDLTSMAKSKKYIPGNQSYAYSTEDYKEQMIPGTLVWLWGENEACLHYYGEEGAYKALQPRSGQKLVFDLNYKLESTAGKDALGMTIFEYDFAANDKLMITAENGQVTWEEGELVTSYLDRVAFVSPLNEYYKEPVVSTVSAGDSPDLDNVKTLYSQTAYLNSEVVKENKARNNLPPIYLWADTDYVNKYNFFTADMTIAAGNNPIGDFPVIIYAEDADYYYGVKANLQNSYALRSNTFKIRKDLDGVVYGVNNITGGVVPIEWGGMNKVTSTDTSTVGAGKSGNNGSGNLYFDGMDVEATKDNTTILAYDTDNLNTPVLGMAVECNYGYSQNMVEIFATLDFGQAYVPKESGLQITKRRISLGSYSIEDLNALPGIMFFNDAWIEAVTYGVDKEFVREKVSELNPGEEETDICEHIFAEYIRVKPTCTAGGYDSYICSRCKTELSYVELDKTPHDYVEKIVTPTYDAQGYTLCTCKKCGHTEKKDYTDKLEATAAPTATPAVEPTELPPSTHAPTLDPEVVPTNIPEPYPSSQPTAIPTEAPTAQPSAVPTEAPTAQPSAVPTEAPTVQPTAVPTEAPTAQPTAVPTEAPSAQATAVPLESPTAQPSVMPTEIPTVQLTAKPSASPTSDKVLQPMVEPTAIATVTSEPSPTSKPDSQPVAVPTKRPAENQDLSPTSSPSSKPVVIPTESPTEKPAIITYTPAASEQMPSSEPVEQAIMIYEEEQNQSDNDTLKVILLSILVLIAGSFGAVVFFQRKYK